MHEKKPLTQSKHYNSFINERDHALEEILSKYRQAMDGIVRTLQTRTAEIAAHITTQTEGAHFAKMNREHFQSRLTPWFNMAIEQAASLLQRMRVSIYVLSYAGSAEAIGRGINKKTKNSLSQSEINQEKQREFSIGGSPHSRMELVFHRLLRDVVDAFQLSQVMESPQKETLERLDRAFPKTKAIPQRIPLAGFKKMRESSAEEEETKKKLQMSFGVIDPDSWEKMLEDYQSNFLPYGAAAYDNVFYPQEVIEAQQGYDWGLQSGLLEDFIDSVRNGEQDSAKDNDIDDLQWLAIIDSKTDECCSSRDGLSSKEIQQKLDDGEEMGGCDEVTPKAHDGCRCKGVPTSERMTEDPPEAPDFQGFDDWIVSKEGNK